MCSAQGATQVLLELLSELILINYYSRTLELQEFTTSYQDTDNTVVTAQNLRSSKHRLELSSNNLQK